VSVVSVVSAVFVLLVVLVVSSLLEELVTVFAVLSSNILSKVVVVMLLTMNMLVVEVVNVLVHVTVVMLLVIVLVLETVVVDCASVRPRASRKSPICSALVPRFSRSPRPSCLCPLAPQHFILPLLRTAQVWEPPQLNLLMDAPEPTSTAGSALPISPGPIPLPTEFCPRPSCPA